MCKVHFKLVRAHQFYKHYILIFLLYFCGITYILFLILRGFSFVCFLCGK